MPGFPDIGRDNPFLMSRTDGSIIDAKPYTVNPVSCLSQLLIGGEVEVGVGIALLHWVWCLFWLSFTNPNKDVNDFSFLIRDMSEEETNQLSLILWLKLEYDILYLAAPIPISLY